ncbi:MAG TPA: RHS repeat-associated core domain-containing protein [Tepidisphaeraceae bacterium]|nr:RHS repeat-associated core domain-containing protein [Tepidisphaeraceae bacterium]
MLQAAWAAVRCLPQITALRQSYSSQLACCDGPPKTYQFSSGNNWVAGPYIAECNGVVTVVMGACQTYTFDEVDGQYRLRHGGRQTLAADSGNGVLRFTDVDGSAYEFNDMGQAEPGQLANYTSPGGDTMEVTSYAGGVPQEVVRSTTTGGVTTTDSYLFEQVSAGVNAGLRGSCTLRRTTNGGSTWTELRRTRYSYYEGGSGEYGELGDLQTVEEQVKDGSGAWVTLHTHYFRYYKQGDADGFPHGLKFVIGPEAFARIAQVTDPLAAPDYTIAQYADQYFEYDVDRRVTRSVTNAGLLDYTISYATNGAGDDYNNWRRKTMVIRPDGTIQLTYTNFIGQELLTDLADGSDHWIEARTYGDSGGDFPGLLVQLAHPSAVVSYVDNGGGGSDQLVVTLRSAAGRIETYEYYNESLGTSAYRYPSTTHLKEGTGGTPVPQSLLTYTVRSTASGVVYPMFESTVYRNDDGTGGITTTYAYTWHGSTLQAETRTTTLPVVSTGQNGSNSSDVRRERFDTYGNLTAFQDERGYITTTTYNVAKGAVLQTVQDAPAPSGSGWTANGGTRLELTADYESDAMGRVTQTLGPVHDAVISGTNTTLRTAAWTVYDELNDRTLTGRGFATGSSPSYTYALVDPVTIATHDQDDRTIQSVVSKRTSGSGRLSASDTFDQADWTRWGESEYSDQNQLTASATYHLIPASGTGSEGTNYDTTAFGYDAMDRQNRVRSPGGTITRTVRDARGLVTQTWVGTDDAGATEDNPAGSGSPNNMVQIAASEYDGGSDGGDGNLTESTWYASGSDLRVTAIGYDWRNRRTSEDGEIDFYATYTYDNLGRVVQADRYDTTSGGNLIGRTQTLYDDRGRVYLTKQFEVDPSSGTLGNALTGNAWYDPAGNVIKAIAPGAGQYAFTKTSYDPVGRVAARFVGWGTDTTYASAAAVTNDTVMEQAEPTYDDASNVLSTAAYQRLNDATGTGALSESTQPKARISYGAAWYDGVGRTVGTADYGALTGAFTRPTTPPGRSDTVLVSSVEYDGAGDPYATTDPRALERRRIWDNAGRLAEQVDDDGGLGRTTRWSYTPDGQTATLTALNATTGDQTTTYAYGTTLLDSGVARSDLLRTVAYPDSGGPSDALALAYNRLGQVATRTDQRGVERSFDYDKLGRPTEDRVTDFGGTGAVDDAVKRVSRAYEVRGMVSLVTSHDDATVGSGAVVNQVAMAYDDLSQLIAEEQSHAGAVGGGTPAVSYGYAFLTSTSNQARPTTLGYPNGQILNYGYGTSTGTNSRLSRVGDLVFGISYASAAYTYLGMNAVVRVDYAGPGVRLDLWGGTSGVFAGLDRFGRVVDQRWQNNVGSTPADVDRYQYGYDRNSSRQWRRNTTASGLDEYYTYDGLDRLVAMRRGTLTGTPPSGIAGTPAAEQDWGLDPTGNWDAFEVKAGGTTTLDQARTANAANEITAVTASTGTNWADPAYDPAGNMTTVPQPAALASGYTGVYDAWNRLVELKDGSDTVAKYQYDGRNRRVVVESYTAGTLSETRHFYFNSAWQIVEERVGSSADADRQYVWGIRYIDDLVLRERTLSGPSIERLYACQDANFNVTTLVDTGGSPAERYAYDPYGSPRFYNGSWSAIGASAKDMTVLYAGYRYDLGTGLYCVRRRYLHPSLGLWIGRDPLGHLAGVNLYQYVLSRPLGLIDSFGLDATLGGILLGGVSSTLGEAGAVSITGTAGTTLTVTTTIETATGVSGSVATGSAGSGGISAGAVSVAGILIAAAAGAAIGFAIHESGLGQYIGTDWAGEQIAEAAIGTAIQRATDSLKDAAPPKFDRESNPAPKECRCKWIPIPAIRQGSGGFKNGVWSAHDRVVIQLQGHADGWKVITPGGASCDFDAWVLTRRTLYEVKAGHEWMWNRPVSVHGQVDRFWQQITRYAKQFSNCQYVAETCGYKYQVVTDNDAGAMGLNKYFFPNLLHSAATEYTKI